MYVGKLNQLQINRMFGNEIGYNVEVIYEFLEEKKKKSIKNLMNKLCEKIINFENFD